MKRTKMIRTNSRDEWDQKYLIGPTPWDTQITPPEVVSFWRSPPLETYRLALDLGCGTGTNLCFLAEQGLDAVGFDLSAVAIDLGIRKMQDAPEWLRRRVHFVQSDVSRLPVLAGQADYVLDIGCLHGLPDGARQEYATSIKLNTRPGAFYHVFAFDRVRQTAAKTARGARGMENDEVERLFAPEFEVVQIDRGEPDHRPCRWYLLQRL